MSRVINFKNSLGTNAMPTADGDFFTGRVDHSLGFKHEFYFEFFSDEELTVPATPTGGTITVSGSPMGNIFLEASSVPLVNATEVSYPDGAYTNPVIEGVLENARITLNGITGAAYLKAIVYTTL